MDQRSAVTRLVLGGGAFGLGVFMGTPPEPTPSISANRYGMISTAIQAELSAASSTERSNWRADLLEEEAELRDQIDALLGPLEPNRQDQRCDALGEERAHVDADLRVQQQMACALKPVLLHTQQESGRAVAPLLVHVDAAVLG